MSKLTSNPTAPMQTPVRDDTSPFHRGEVEMQRRSGMDERLHEIGDKVIRDHLPEAHRAFFRGLPSLYVGSVDSARRPWASLLAGAPGFVFDVDARHLRVDALPSASDPLGGNLVVGAMLGLLGLEPHTRRRNRMNGVVVAVDARGFEVEVRQSFGNCPQYIQARSPQWRPTAAGAVRESAAWLDGAARLLVERADTFFIASAAPVDALASRNGGVDVSHRGGKPGFLKVAEDDRSTVLTFPEFRGNYFFNTLGNLLLHPHAGLLFVDHETGDLLQVAGRVVVIDDAAAPGVFHGAERWVEVHVERSVWRERASPLRWTPPIAAPQLEATGHWR